MNLNYSDSKLYDWSWINIYQERLGKKVFFQFLDIVYGWLMTLKPGQSIDIINHEKITERNRDLVVKIGCLFIIEGNNDYQFSDDFTQIKNNRYVPKQPRSTKSKDLGKKR